MAESPPSFRITVRPTISVGCGAGEKGLPLMSTPDLAPPHSNSPPDSYTLRFAIASDHRGFALKRKLVSHLQNLGIAVADMGCDDDRMCDYPDYAARVARAVAGGEVDRGVLLCGSGIGMCLVANKFPGVRAASCQTELAVEFARRHHDANVLCLPADLLGGRSPDRMVDVFLATQFRGERHARRLDKILEIEHELTEGGYHNFDAAPALDATPRSLAPVKTKAAE